MEAKGRNVSPNDHSGGFSNPTAFGPWDFYNSIELEIPEMACELEINS